VYDIVYKVQMSNVGCYISSICACIYLYADDILLLAPTVAGLQYILNVCEEELLQLDMCISVKKSVSIRFGPRFNADSVEMSSKFGGTLKRVNICRYLGIYFVSGRTLNYAFCNAKSHFFRSFNSMRSMAKLDVLPPKNVY